jgi:hypothetical protein
VAQQVKEYRDSKQFRKDARRLAIEGWEVVSSTGLRARSGCLRLLLMGPFAIMIPPRDRVIVTYWKRD